jgi:hypothetical protein
MMTDKEALLYVADKIGIQCQYYLDTGEQRFMDALVAYMKTGNIYITRLETKGEKYQSNS